MLLTGPEITVDKWESVLTAVVDEALVQQQMRSKIEVSAHDYALSDLPNRLHLTCDSR